MASDVRAWRHQVSCLCSHSSSDHGIFWWHVRTSCVSPTASGIVKISLLLFIQESFLQYLQRSEWTCALLAPRLRGVNIPSAPRFSCLWTHVYWPRGGTSSTRWGRGFLRWWAWPSEDDWRSASYARAKTSTLQYHSECFCSHLPVFNWGSSVPLQSKVLVQWYGGRMHNKWKRLMIQWARVEVEW